MDIKETLGQEPMFSSDSDSVNIQHPAHSDTSRQDEEKSALPPQPSETPEAPAQTPVHPSFNSEVPDGGLSAWLQVFGSWGVLFNTWGVVNSFGVFQTYYETELLTSNSSSDISWIGSLQAALLMIGGIISGPLFDAGYFQELNSVGLFLIVLGQFMTSLCWQYWQVVVAQGICIGLGCGLSFVPSTAIISQYFAKRRALALGVASSGSPIAGIILPIIFSRLQPSIGFGWATRVVAFILLAISVIPLAFMRTRIPASGRMRALFDPTALRDKAYLIFIGSGFFAFLGLYVPFFYIQLYSLRYGLSPEWFSGYLVTLMNAGSVVGRLVPNYIADKVGSLECIITCVSISAVLVFAWIGIQNLPGLIAFAILYGCFSGGVVSLIPSGFVRLSPDLSKLGTRMGMGFVVQGVACLIGTPIGGAALGDSSNARWKGTIGYAAATLLIATGGHVAVWSLVRSRKTSEKR